MFRFLKRLLIVFRDAFIFLRYNDPLILASATAFFATFSLSPIIVLLVNVLSLYYFQSELISHQLFEKLKVMLGNRTASEIEMIVNNFMSFKATWWVTIVGFIFLLFVATTLLGIIRKSIHQIWFIRRKSSVKLKYNVKERLIGIALLMFIGLLFVISQLLDTSLTVFHHYLVKLIGANTFLVHAINIIFSILVVTSWFTVLFKILPEARVKWKVALAGGLVTGLLFSLGKYILGLLLVESNLKTIFGASASIALLLLFIFYASMIMYYGAAFTYAFGKVFELPISAGKYADEYEENVIEKLASK